MGRQVNFFIVPGDLPAIEQAIQATGDICFLADHTASAEPDQLPGLEGGSNIHGAPRRTIYLARRDDLSAVSTRYVAARQFWLVEGTRSPVIEFTAGVFDGTTLGRGRAYFASDLRFREELPSPEFVRWGDRVLRRIKKQLTRNPEVAPGWMYLSTAALHWVQMHNALLDGGAHCYRAQDHLLSS